MASEYKPPLAVHFIWHPSDYDLVDPVLQTISQYLSRDVNRPFSRHLNIPVFYYSSNSPTLVPFDYPQEVATRNVLFVFTSVNTMGRDTWSNYVKRLPTTDSMRAVPIALDKDGLGHGAIGGSLKGLNCLRAYEWSSTSRQLNAIIDIAHEIYRYGFIEIEADDVGKSSSIKIFLSHAKSGNTGRLHAEEIKKFIDNTNMRRFFDAQEISPGFKFDEEIRNHISGSTMVSIASDAYSARYWCQLEILCAKQKNIPMIVVNCLDDYEDRIFPAGSNVPCVHVHPETPLKETDVLRILAAALLETIRHCHAIRSLENYRNQQWIDRDCEVYSRPPEIRQLLELKDAKKQKVCYPEPPLYSEEADWHAKLDIDAITPLWSRVEGADLEKLRVGISISDVANDGYSENHLPASHSIRLAQDLARHLLARSATLIYGGDLRKDGFTEFILDEAIALKNRLATETIHVENHLAWPIYLSDPEVTAWRAKFRSVMTTEEHKIPEDIKNSVDEKVALPPTSPKNIYVWSRCLTEMRTNSIASSHARICSGGKLLGYKGKMPGVLEEIVMAIEMGKPIYLLGAFGGVVGEVCNALLDKGNYPESLTGEWQVLHNSGYANVQSIARAGGHHADYEHVKVTLQSVDFEVFAAKAGLSNEEYKRLMTTPFVDECVHLTIKGLKTLLYHSF